MKNIKKILAVFILCCITMVQPIYADENNNNSMSDDDLVQTGEYFINVLNYIQQTYVGGDITNKMLLQAAIAGMAQSLDEYSTYFTYDEYDKFMQSISSEIYTIGIMYERGSDGYPIVVEILQDSPAMKNKLMINDKLVAINSLDISKLSSAEISDKISSNTNTPISISIMRDGQKINFNMTMEPVKLKTVYTSPIEKLITADDSIDNKKVGYMHVTTIADKTADDFKVAVDEMTKNNVTNLILDLRGNTGGIVEQAVEICNLIVPEGVIVHIKDKEGNTKDEKSELKKKPFNNIIVLTDSMTASAAEIIASALQDSGSMVVGSKTYGKGVIQTIRELPEIGMIKLTAMEYYSRNGSKINKKGITPNIQVEEVSFLSETDTDIQSDKIKKAFAILGYKITDKDDMVQILKQFQLKQNIPQTGELDIKTINALNLAVYKGMVENDKVLAEGYKQLVYLMKK